VRRSALGDHRAGESWVLGVDYKLLVQPPKESGLSSASPAFTGRANDLHVLIESLGPATGMLEARSSSGRPPAWQPQDRSAWLYADRFSRTPRGLGYRDVPVAGACCRLAVRIWEAIAVRLLVLGGSWFVGRAMIVDTKRRGWDVTAFNRGRSRTTPAGVRLVRGDRERAEDLERLAAAGPWDVAIDIAGSVPSVVRDTARALADVVDRYVFISTISAYRDWPHLPVAEN
jgi:hypothetical protein